MKRNALIGYHAAYYHYFEQVAKLSVHKSNLSARKSEAVPTTALKVTSEDVLLVTTNCFSHNHVGGKTWLSVS